MSDEPPFPRSTTVVSGTDGKKGASFRGAYLTRGQSQRQEMLNLEEKGFRDTYTVQTAPVVLSSVGCAICGAEI
jgi:hypothetical protein